MGRYSEPLAAQFASLAGVRRGQRVLDVGCGPGALTAELVNRVTTGTPVFHLSCGTQGLGSGFRRTLGEFTGNGSGRLPQPFPDRCNFRAAVEVDHGDCGGGLPGHPQRDGD